MIFASSGYLLLVAVFGFSGLGKLRSLAAFSRQVADYQLIPGSLTRLAAVAIAVGETACAVLLAVPWTRAAGAGLAVVLLGLFLTAMSLAWSHGRRIPCGCFGGSTSPDAISADTIGPGTMVRTALLGAVALGTLLVSRGDQPAGQLPVHLLLAGLMLILVFLLAEATRLLGGEAG
jgi:hypothetical protein